MPDERLGTQDSIGIVLKSEGKPNKIVRDLGGGIADMRDGKTELQLEEMFRYFDELRTQNISLVNERRDLMELNRQLKKRVEEYTAMVERQEKSLEGYRIKIKGLSNE